MLTIACGSDVWISMWDSWLIRTWKTSLWPLCHPYTALPYISLSTTIFSVTVVVPFLLLVIICHDKRQLWGGRVYLTYNSRRNSSFWRSQDRNSCSWSITSVSTENKCFLACSIFHTSFPFSYSVLFHLPREWCHPKWTGSSHTN